MAKQAKFTLDAQETLDFFDDMLENTAVLMWNTRYSAYTLAFFLNRLYGFDLKPETELAIDCNKQNVECSVFSYHNYVEKCSYFLIDIDDEARQRIKELSYFDKILLITGFDSGDCADHIFNDIRSEDGNGNDMLAMQRDELKRCFVDSGVVEVDTFDFSDPDNPSTSFLANALPGTSLYKKQQRFLKFQKNFFQGLFVAIDDLTKDFD